MLAEYGVDVHSALSIEKIRELITRSKEHGLGVRWVSAQLENILLGHIRERGVSFGANTIGPGNYL